MPDPLCAEVTDMEGQIPRCSVPDKPDGIWPAYHIYHSLRIQEDQSLSKYFWVRLENTWYHTCVIYTDSTGRPAALNASIIRIDENTVTIKETVTKQKRIINLANEVIARESW